MNQQSILKEYVSIHDEYTKKYGEQTVVLMEVGSFFEIYAVINDTMNIGPDIYHICQNILQISVTKRNKKINEISEKNYLQAGFPNVSVQKFETILLNHHYTVVIVEHITAPPNPERAVTRVVSPGTTLDNFNKQDSHYLMSVYIEKYDTLNKQSYVVGVSVIDVSTGKNYLHSITSKMEDSNHWSDEIGRYIHFYNPCEILFHTKDMELTKNDIIQQWDMSHSSIQMNHYSDSNYNKLSYQNEFLQSIFHLDTMITPIEDFDLERNPELVVSYIYLLQYIHDHRADTLTNIEKPEIVINNTHLCLTSNSIRQLNVINNYSYFKGKNESLLSVTNSCVTPMGRRLCKERLLYPSIDPDTIQNRYQSIELLQTDKFYETIQNDLRRVSDLEKSLRKMGLHLLQPNELFSDSLSFDYVNKVITSLENESSFLDHYKYSRDYVSSFKDFYETIQQTFQFPNFSTTSTLERSMFKKNISQEIDSYDSLTEELIELLMLTTKRLSNFLDSSESNIKLDYDERNHWHIYCTNKRASTIKEKFSNIPNNSIHIKDETKTIHSLTQTDINYQKKDKSNTILDFQWIRMISKKLCLAQHKLTSLNKQLWEQVNTDLYTQFNEPLKQFYMFLANVDVYCSGAKLSIQNKYCRPKIVDSSKSFCKVKEIRHPIVEKIHTHTEYVTNDIQLGKDDQDGIILFGTNACGKSTFMKAIGLNIILAQAGFYVSATEFEYYPYTQIFTRILNNDNIFRSQSSFAVEVQELKTIMDRSDKCSLVLGDELCSGTESMSALSIITTGLKYLCKKQCTFIFTSHLHQLTSIEAIKQMNNLRIFHLKIKYDKETNELIYDRKLTEGSGPSIYGLQVCEAMGMNPSFISDAKQILNQLTENGTVMNQKQSLYNADIFMNECQICSKKGDLETHHIKDQQFADKNNMIDHHHKNIQHNLVPLCKECHLKVTHHQLTVVGWKQTSSGRKLEWFLNQPKQIKSKKKFSKEQEQIIRDMRNQMKQVSMSDFVKHLEITNNINIGIATLRKILNNKY